MGWNVFCLTIFGTLSILGLIIEEAGVIKILKKRLEKICLPVMTATDLDRTRDVESSTT